MEIKERVKYLINEYKECNPFKLAKLLDIQLDFQNLGKLYGYHTTFKRVSLIRINQNLTYEQQLFTCAHELGHHVLHPHINTPFLNKRTLFSNDKIETEAHTFALELLFHHKDVITDNDLSLYGIPKQLALLKKFNH